MIDLATLLNFVPLTPQAIFVLLVDSLLAAIAIIAVNKLLAHEFEIKHALILSIVALFFTPVISALVLSFIAPPMWITLYVLPLFVWIVLGEALLSSDMMTKLKVVAIAFVVHIILSLYIAPILMTMIPFF